MPENGVSRIGCGATADNGYERLLRLRDVQEITGLTAPAIAKFVTTGYLPKPVRIGTKAKRWRLSEINEWIENLPKIGA